MASHDGHRFKVWPEAFIRPGPVKRGRWVYGDNFQCWGIVETKSERSGAFDELSFYVTEGYWRPDSRIRRYTLRIDGFVSVRAPLTGGELITKPVRFQGKRLVINLSTSAAGSVRVEIQSIDGQAIEGFALADCPEVFGDETERVVTFKGGSDVSQLAGKAIRLRFVVKDADLYSFRFAE